MISTEDRDVHDYMYVNPHVENLTGNAEVPTITFFP